jgi:hypothetical protein
LKVLPGIVDPILGALWRARIGELSAGRLKHEMNRGKT